MITGYGLPSQLIEMQPLACSLYIAVRPAKNGGEGPWSPGPEFFPRRGAPVREISPPNVARS